MLRNLNFSKEQGKDFNKGKSGQVCIFCEVMTFFEHLLGARLPS